MRTIKLEVLRDGPPHNQLLSPLTGYLALCGEHAPSTFRLPFGHAQWLARLSSMAYRDSARSRELNLQDIAATMASLLEQVPGLVAELAKCHTTSGDISAPHSMVHFRVVHNANELALLPFELANAPAGFPAQGQALALQTLVPLCITREVRRAPTQEWLNCVGTQPRVLFAFAEPAAAVPYEEHLLALRQCVDPWVCHWTKNRDIEARRRCVESCLTVLPFATLSRLQQACEKGLYTHVHILAHGAEFQQGEDHRFGIALHGKRRTEVDIVDGERLATALRPHLNDCAQPLACPHVVTLASCDSGNTGSVIGAGSSVAHELHVKGIPLVVASQYPLTIRGSIRLVQTLYGDFMWGRDPRCTIDKLRRDLKVAVPDSHDWASIIAYACLPADIEQQCIVARYQRASHSIDVALNLADGITADICRTNARGKWKVPEGCESELQRQRQPAEWLGSEPMRKLEQARKHLEGLLASDSGIDVVKIRGRLAASHKRAAEVLLDLSSELKESEAAKVATFAHAREQLQHAIVHYQEVYKHESDQAWGEVQSLVLECVTKENPTAGHWWQRWQIARDLSEVALKRAELFANCLDESRSLQATWACGNLIELWMLAYALRWDPDKAPPTLLDSTTGDCDGKTAADEQRYLDLAVQHARRLLTYAPVDSQEVRCTRRQVRRYARSFYYLMTGLPDTTAETADVAERLLTAASAVQEAFKTESA